MHTLKYLSMNWILAICERQAHIGDTAVAGRKWQVCKLDLVQEQLLFSPSGSMQSFRAKVKEVLFYFALDVSHSIRYVYKYQK